MRTERRPTTHDQYRADAIPSSDSSPIPRKTPYPQLRAPFRCAVIFPHRHWERSREACAFQTSRFQNLMVHVNQNHTDCGLECPLCSHSTILFELLPHMRHVHADSEVWKNETASPILCEDASKLAVEQAPALENAGNLSTGQMTPLPSGNATAAAPTAGPTVGETTRHADPDARDCYICGEAITLRRKRDWQ